MLEELFGRSQYYDFPSFEVAVYSLLLAFVLSTVIGLTYRLTFEDSRFPKHFFQAIVLSSTLADYNVRIDKEVRYFYVKNIVDVVENITEEEVYVSIEDSKVVVDEAINVTNQAEEELIEDVVDRIEKQQQGNHSHLNITFFGFYTKGIRLIRPLANISSFNYLFQHKKMNGCE